MSSFVLHTHGYLEIIIGPMFAGKTTKLVEIYNMCIQNNISVCVINHVYDDRYHETMMSTHDKIMVSCIKAKNLKDIINEDIYIQSQVILINESQFFSDLHESVITMLQSNKNIYVSGLDGDFQMKKIGHIIDIIPLCDKVTKLTSICSLCNNGTPGIFSKRITNENTQVVIGSNNYISLCRKCYNIY